MKPLRSRRQYDLARQRRLGLVRPEDVDDVDHMRRGRHALEIELADGLDMVEHLGQLGRHPIDLFVVQLQPGQPGHMENLVTIEHLLSILGVVPCPRPDDGDVTRSIPRRDALLAH